MPDHLVETHAHTNAVSPCGRLSPRELVTAYAAAGYSAIVTTDHLVSTLPIFRGVTSWRERVRLYFAGFREARSVGLDLGLEVLPGFEITMSAEPGRDFLVYGIDEAMLREMPDVCTGTLTQLRDLADQAGALIVQAHPFRNTTPADHVLLDGVEVYNGNPRHDSRNDLAEAFAVEHDLIATSGSDAHQRDDVARGGLVVSSVPRTSADLVGLLRRTDRSFALRRTPAAA